MIPKKIHYCWFGGKAIPHSVIKCIDSWERYCPDYEIIQWNETNYEIEKSRFTKDAFKTNRWAFVSDLARLEIIYNHGGIYFDTDVEVIRNLDDLLEYKAFIGFEGYEYINTGSGFGAIPRCNIIKEMMEIYEGIDFLENVNNLANIATPILITSLAEKKGLVKNGEMQVVEELTILPQEYFCPKNPVTRIVNVTPQTHSIHHYGASWVDENEREIISKLEHDAKELQKKQAKKVSIIIPVYNGSSYVREAIDSALTQTYKNLEVIVVNDGSHDDTEEIAKSYGNSIRYFSKENGGVSSALNLGIEKATGHYISWLSHDDKYYPDKIEQQVSYADNFDDKTIIVSNWTIIDGDGNVVKDNNLDIKLEKYPACFLAFDRKTWLNGCAMLIPRSLFEMYGNFDLALKSTQDYDMWYRLSDKVKYKILPKHLHFSRAHAKQGCLSMPSAINDSDLIHSKIIESLSQKEIMAYFEESVDNIWPVYDSFYNSGYKRTPAAILKIVNNYFANKGNHLQASEVINQRLNGNVNLSYFDKNNASRQFKTKKTKKRLLFCSAHWYTGGVERTLTNLFNDIKEDYDVYLISAQTDVKSCIKIPEEVTHIIVSDEMFRNKFDYVIYAYSLLFDIDYVIGCMNLFERFIDFYDLAKGSKFKTIASNHEYYFFPHKCEYYYPVIKKREGAFKNADAVIWLTNFSAGAYKYITDNNNGYLIPNPNTFQIQDNDITIKKDKIILCVGRFDDQVKRVDRILKCFKTVLKKIPDAKLILVGRANRNIQLFENKTINDFLKELSLSEKNVFFEGEVTDPGRYYSEASLLLLTSESEGFPMVLNEAGCFGLPVVCNSIPGIEDIIQDGGNGYITKQDDIESMAERVCEILNDDNLRIKLGKKAKELVERYESKVVSKKWIDLFDLLSADNVATEKFQLAKERFDTKIENIEEFTKIICREFNNIFYHSIGKIHAPMDNNITIVNASKKNIKKKFRNKIIDYSIRFFTSLRDNGIKSTMRKIPRKTLNKWLFRDLSGFRN